jgi:drug/metabolite transporter (DMT)-like permease
MRLRADLTLLLVSALWGSAFAAQRVAGQLGSVYFFNGARFLIAATLLLPFTFRTRVRRDQWLWMFAAGAVLFIAGALQQEGLLSTTAGNAGFLTCLYVVLVPFVLWLGWKERPRWSAILAVVLAGTGAFLLSTAGRFAVRAGDALELGGAVFWAFHVVLVGKFASRFESISFSAGQLLIGGAFSLLAGGVTKHPALSWPAPLIAAILYTAVISLGLGYTLQLWGQKHTPPTDAAIILSLESVFAVLAGRLLLQESLLEIQVVGCIIILAAVLLSQFRRRGPDEAPSQAGDGG